MAPTGRRRGTNRAAAAAAAEAAARRKWKEGDLVIAKLRGFAAWPAKVLYPAKWGLQTDWKKVPVYFFGTKQIASCCPGDVQEFTEEKKVNLGKRNVKDPNFSRAVREIIDCFENLKKQGSIHGYGETSFASGNNSGQLIVYDKNEAALSKAFEEPRVCVTSLIGSKTRRCQSGRGSWTRSFAQCSSSRIDAGSSEVRLLRSSEGVKSSSEPEGHILTGSAVNTKLITDKIPPSAGASRLDIVVSEPEVLKTKCASIGNKVKMVKRSAKDDLDGHINSTCKPAELIIETNEGELKISDRLGGTVISKKKRKRNGKPVSNDTAGASRLDIVVSEAKVLKTKCISIGNTDKMIKRSAKDVDGHINSTSKPAEVIIENDNGELKISDRLDGTVISKKKGKRNGKPVSNDIAGASRLDIVVSEAKVLKTKCIPIGNTEKMLKRSAKDVDGHINSTGKSAELITKNNEGELKISDRLDFRLNTVIHKKKRQSNRKPVSNDTAGAGRVDIVVSEAEELKRSAKDVLDGHLPLVKRARVRVGSPSPAVEQEDTSKMLIVPESLDLQSSGSLNLKSDAPADVESIPNRGDPPNSSLSHAGPLKKSQFWVTRKNNVDDEAALPPSKRLNRALEAMSANVAENGQISSSSPTGNICRNSVKNLDSQSNTSEFHDGLNMKMAENEANVSTVVSASAKTPCNMNSSNPPESCKQSLIDAEGSGSKRLDISPSHGCPAEVISEHQHLKPDSTSIHEELTHLESQNKAAAIFMEGITTNIQTDNPDGDGDIGGAEKNKVKHLLLDQNNQESQGPEFVAEAKPVTVNSSFMPSTTPVKAKLASTSSKEKSLLSFEAHIRSLTRTKESIGRATRVAMDCAKFGFSKKVVEILTRSLESEASLSKKVDLFFLVDSITQSSRVKGYCTTYPLEVQAQLPRLLLNAAPPGSSSHENNKQCLKVLRVWQARKILPEPILSHHIRVLETLGGKYQSDGGSRRDIKNEKAFDYPNRKMGGMLVNEYGSNSNYQLPGFSMPPMLKDNDGGNDSDGDNFEAVTPVRSVENLDVEKTPIPVTARRCHILKDVDVELEMEDVAPYCDVEITPSSNVAEANRTQISLHQYKGHYGESSFTHQQPKDTSLPPAPFQSSSSLAPPSVRHPVPPSAVSVAQMSRQKPDCSYSSPLSGRANINHPADGASNNGFHLRPPRPPPSNQFSYIQERGQPRRNKYPPPGENIGEGWRPPFSPISGTAYHNDSRMAGSYSPYIDSPRRTASPNNRWIYSPRPVNHRSFHPYAPSGHTPGANRGPKFWR